MQEAQFVFVTEAARVIAKLSDGTLEDVTESAELLPPKKAAKLNPAEELERKRAALYTPAA